MKHSVIILLFFLDLNSYGNYTIDYSSNPCDTIILIEYVNGRPSMDYISTAKEVAQTWGFELQHEFGGCIHTKETEQRNDEINKLNIQAVKCLERKFGKHWRNEFHKEVLSKLKK